MEHMQTENQFLNEYWANNASFNQNISYVTSVYPIENSVNAIPGGVLNQIKDPLQQNQEHKRNNRGSKTLCKYEKSGILFDPHKHSTTQSTLVRIPFAST